MHKAGLFGLEAEEELTPEEQSRFLRWITAILCVYENIFMQYQAGLYDRDYWETTISRTGYSFQIPKTQDLMNSYWERMQTGFVADFVEEVNKHRVNEQYAELFR